MSKAAKQSLRRVGIEAIQRLETAAELGDTQALKTLLDIARSGDG
jgi:hypothetical protein